MKPRKITCARYYKLKNSCFGALEFSEKRYGKLKLNDEDPFLAYEDAEKRYDYSCKLLTKKISKLGIDLPSKYRRPDNKFMCYESNFSIGEHFNELMTIYKKRRSILEGKIRVGSNGQIIKNRFVDKDGAIPENVQAIICQLEDNGINWRHDNFSDDWIILIEPRSQKKVKIEVDRYGCMKNCINLEKLKNALMALAKKFNKPFENGSLNEGTLTDCGWHAHLSQSRRIEALDIAISIYGKSRIVKALQVTLNSPWMAGYSRNIQKDIDYASGGRFVRLRGKNWDARIYIKIA